MKNLIIRIFSLLLFFAFSSSIASAQQPGKRGGNASNFFATDFFGGQNAHLQSGAFGDQNGFSRWISTGQPFVPSGTEFYGTRIQDREYVGIFSLNARNGNNAEKDLEISYGFTEPNGTTVKSNLNWRFVSSPFDSEIRMTLTAGGTLGIGTATSNQSFRLDVNGKTRCTLGVWSASDKRYKEDFKELSDVTSKLAQLKGLSYKFKNEVINGVDFRVQDDRRDIGFIAQDLEKVFPDLVIKDESGYYSVRYEGLVPVLVEGFNDQQELLDEQALTISNLTETADQQSTTITALNDKVDRLEDNLQQILTALAQSDSPASLRITPSNTSLEQNRPNPFKGMTTIDYVLPSNVDNAQLVVLSLDGKQIKTINVTNRQGSVNFDGSNLAPGTYFYSLNANGQQLAQQKMVVQ